MIDYEKNIKDIGKLMRNPDLAREFTFPGSFFFEDASWKSTADAEQKVLKSIHFSYLFQTVASTSGDTDSPFLFSVSGTTSVRWYRVLRLPHVTLYNICIYMLDVFMRVCMVSLEWVCVYVCVFFLLFIFDNIF